MSAIGGGVGDPVSEVGQSIQQNGVKQTAVNSVAGLADTMKAVGQGDPNAVGTVVGTVGGIVAGAKIGGKIADLADSGAAVTGTSNGVANSATGALLRESLAQDAGIPRTLSGVWGSSLDDLKASYSMDGRIVTDKPPRASSSGNAQIFTVDAPSDGSVVVKQVQYSPSSADSVHGGQYYKFTYTDGSTVKVIDPSHIQG